MSNEKGENWSSKNFRNLLSGARTLEFQFPAFWGGGLVCLFICLVVLLLYLTYLWMREGFRNLMRLIAQQILKNTTCFICHFSSGPF